MQQRSDHYIGGEWVPSTGDGAIDVVSPSTEAVVGRVPAGGAADVDRAASAAAGAFGEWSATPVEDRAAALERIHAGLEARSKEIAETIAAEMGAPLEDRAAHPGRAAPDGARLVPGDPARLRVRVRGRATRWSCASPSASSARSRRGTTRCTRSWRRSPPRSPPAAPSCSSRARSRRCRSSASPRSSPPRISRRECSTSSAGRGPVVGEALAAHPLVDMVSFTGSTRAGPPRRRARGRGAQEGGARARREVRQRHPRRRRPRARGDGGRQELLPQLRSDLHRADEDARPRGADGRGRGHRLVRSREAFRPGDPFSADANLGPLASEVQRDRVRHYITTGVAEGARLVTGGAERAGRARARLLRPADRLRGRDQRHDDRPGGDLRSGAVDHPLRRRRRRGADRQRHRVRALRRGVVGDAGPGAAVARRLRTGQVEINGGAFNPVAPFGGYKHSGVGRELGRFGLDEYLEVKSLCSADRARPGFGFSRSVGRGPRLGPAPAPRCHSRDRWAVAWNHARSRCAGVAASVTSMR